MPKEFQHMQPLWRNTKRIKPKTEPYNLDFHLLNNGSHPKRMLNSLEQSLLSGPSLTLVKKSKDENAKDKGGG